MAGQSHRVGIIMLMYNRADMTCACLQSLTQAQVAAPWELCLLDNGSRSAESEKAKAQFDQLVQEGRLRGQFIRSEVNHGFARGNNMGIRHFLARSDISHICFLNNDVILTDHWLDRLLERDADAIGPVTNACGNEQTIPVPMTLDAGQDVFGVVNQWAQERYESFRGYCKDTQFLGFFCFLARVELFLTVGFLDEQFGRGAYEDDDYCIRILAKGYRMRVARDVFIYHWGTSSFIQIPSLELRRHLRRNRKLFERKHDCDWKDRSLLPLVSVWDDMAHMAQNTGEANRPRVAGFSTWCMNYVGHLLHKKSLQTPHGLWRETVQPRWNRLLQWNRLRRVNRAVEFLRAICARRPVMVLGRWYPTDADMNDGYFQRVRQIDENLQEHCRIYLRIERTEGIAGVLPKLSRKAPRAYELSLRPQNPFHWAVAVLSMLICRRICVHSVLRFSNPLTRLLYRLARVRVFDVHGVVPEEFSYEGDEEHARQFGDLERWAVQRASVLVVVTQAMGDHLRAKDGDGTVRQCACLTNLPHIARWQTEAADARRDGRIIYCGGLHKWQQVPKMLEYARRSADQSRFTFLVTQPEEVRRLYRERYGEEFPGTICSAPRAEVPEWYRTHAFGLALREKIAVNTVACPTKLVEYLQHGLVPIVETPDIGDFKRYGYRYVSMDEPLPTAADCAAMAQANRDVLRQLYYQSLCGSEHLKQSLRG